MTALRIGGPAPGDLGWLIGLHGRWYSEHMGFDLGFERIVAGIAADVSGRLSPPRVNMLVARDDSGPLSTLTADADDPDEVGRGHIRIVITEPRARGLGLAGRLLTMGLDGLRAAGAPGAYLDTFAGLDAARRVYERAGFRLTREAPGRSWGQETLEQRFVMDFG